ncbi:CDP-alcohol phosphatidyltransferase family protein [Xanthobacter autotrophicus]|uniref:CDP-alcohol phosphatidyltransferase family protein n=1 Tax=Xanthobacter autotrophicus TaxID=280 RepID=UPI0024A72282|nr:CDP-alcohol phosphatidyltransferase family protein [Xanthobacter autotrophicus]MDI4657081.1 CDP-alcohol phosphatidyltransferase family protein [Xanthobacter autotrophicus]
MSLPNIITLMRILLVPAVIWSIASSEYALAFWLFLAAGISDALDGFIAKRFHMQTELGSYLDPVADKALLISIYVALAVCGLIPRWVAIAVVSRDVMIIGAVVLSLVMAKPVAISPLLVSKVNTAVQIVFAAFVLAASGFGLDLPGLFQVGLVMVGLLTGLSAAAYLAAWTRHVAS